jgi:hypothetical protein
MAEFGGEWRSLAYPEFLIYVLAGSNFTMLFITRGEKVL